LRLQRRQFSRSCGYFLLIRQAKFLVRPLTLSLQFLYLRNILVLYKPNVDSFGPINLKLISNLRHLLLGITSEMGDISCSPQLLWLTHVLRYDSLPQSLEELTIVLVSTRFGVLSGASWPRLHQTCVALRKVGLDSILSDDERYRKLRKVTILVDAYGKVDEEKGFGSFLSTNLPLLSREGMLHTGFCDIHDVFVKKAFVIPK
jgi:hypothetical protein